MLTKYSKSSNGWSNVSWTCYKDIDNFPTCQLPGSRLNSSTVWWKIHKQWKCRQYVMKNMTYNSSKYLLRIHNNYNSLSKRWFPRGAVVCLLSEGLSCWKITGSNPPGPGNPSWLLQAYQSDFWYKSAREISQYHNNI